MDEPNYKTIERQYSDQRQLAFAQIIPGIAEESQAALRQLSLERVMAYGVDYADAVELRARVQGGQRWQEVATDLAEACLKPSRDVARETKKTRIDRLFRASALLRMSQMMMLEDSEERTAIFTRAGLLFEEAAGLAGDRYRWTIDTQGGPLAGWMYPARDQPAVGQVLVIGGVEGWAMDFGAMGEALAARSLDVLLLDGPGQGESRMIHHHYLTKNWVETYRQVIDSLERRAPNLPIGIIGNSIGGKVVAHFAAREPRIKACCDNGGPSFPRDYQPTFFRKMTAHVGRVSAEEAKAAWATIDPCAPGTIISCPLLVVQGGLDPLISLADAQAIAQVGSPSDTLLIIFSDGDHCIYNHSADKHVVIGDWMVERLTAVQ